MLVIEILVVDFANCLFCGWSEPSRPKINLQVGLLILNTEYQIRGWLKNVDRCRWSGVVVKEATESCRSSSKDPQTGIFFFFFCVGRLVSGAEPCGRRPLGGLKECTLSRYE